MRSVPRLNGNLQGFEICHTCSIGASIAPNNGKEFEDLFKKGGLLLVYCQRKRQGPVCIFSRDELHRKSYEESITRVQHVGTNGREIQELKAIAKFMSDVTENQALAYREILQHMLESYQLDTINIYYGENLSRVYTVGFEQNYSDNAQYVKTQEFKQLLEEKDYMETSFVAGMFNSAPQFCAAMKQKRVFFNHPVYYRDTG